MKEWLAAIGEIFVAFFICTWCCMILLINKCSVLSNAFHNLNILQNTDYVQRIHLQNLGIYLLFLIITLRKVLYCDIFQVKTVITLSWKLFNETWQQRILSQHNLFHLQKHTEEAWRKEITSTISPHKESFLEHMSQQW
jgi:hypothetical protein